MKRRAPSPRSTGTLLEIWVQSSSSKASSKKSSRRHERTKVGAGDLDDLSWSVETTMESE
jgi:hypothetical protein